jgi:hypothetical protein
VHRDSGECIPKEGPPVRVDLSEKILHGLDGPCFQATARMTPRGGSKEAMGAGAPA